jgi:Protein of unknown function (DUF1566)
LTVESKLKVFKLRKFIAVLAFILVLILAVSCDSGVSGGGEVEAEPEPVEPCVDADGDGHYVYIPITCSNGTDYCDDNPLAYSSIGCVSCIDNDGDGYGIDCDFGSDCNDEDPEHYDICPVPRVEPQMRWPDSGQNKCYNSSEEIACPAEGEDYYGQDGNYSINPMSFTDNDDGTVTDNVTGLLWQQEEVIYESHYPLYDTFSEMVDYCDSLSLGGYEDWRIPVFYELLTIIDYSSYNPAMDTGYFYPNENASVVITGFNENVSLVIPTTRTDYYLAFSPTTGDAYAESQDNESKNWFLRCVRENSPYRNGSFDFFDNGDGTITDKLTSLVWQKVANGDLFKWKEALDFCSGLELGGYSDWRLPNIKELGSILNVSKVGGTSPFDYFEVFEASGTSIFGGIPSWFWSSTSDIHTTNSAFIKWYSHDLQTCNKVTGYYLDEQHTIEGASVRCVR